MLGFDLPAGFLQSFPAHGIENRLVFFHVTGWLIEYNFSTAAFFHHQEAAVGVFYNHGYRGVWRPGHELRRLLGVLPDLVGIGGFADFGVVGKLTGILRYLPGSSPSSDQSPIRLRVSRNRGNPTAAVIRRTCRVRPSAMGHSGPRAGTVLRLRTGGTPGQRPR